MYTSKEAYCQRKRHLSTANAVAQYHLIPAPSSTSSFGLLTAIGWSELRVAVVWPLHAGENVMVGFQLDFWDYVTLAVLFFLGVVLNRLCAAALSLAGTSGIPASARMPQLNITNHAISRPSPI